MARIEDSIDQNMSLLIRQLAGQQPRDTEDQGEQQHEQHGEVVDMNTRIRRAAGYGNDAA